MTYEYKCEKCGKSIELDQLISRELPKTVKCSCGGQAIYSWNNARQGIHIPPHMRAGNTEMNCGKMHREQKSFF